MAQHEPCRMCGCMQCCLTCLIWRPRHVSIHTQLPLVAAAVVILQDFRTVILINCGASCYVKDLAPEASKNVRYIVIDSHRPIHPSYNDTSDLDVLLVLAEDDPLPQREVPAVCELDLMTQQRE